MTDAVVHLSDDVGEKPTALGGLANEIRVADHQRVKLGHVDELVASYAGPLSGNPTTRPSDRRQAGGGPQAGRETWTSVDLCTCKHYACPLRQDFSAERCRHEEVLH